MTKYTTISIPEPLAERLKEFIGGTGFKSMSDFVTFMLREFFSDSELSEKSYTGTKEEIRRRLKALGYID